MCTCQTHTKAQPADDVVQRLYNVHIREVLRSIRCRFTGYTETTFWHGTTVSQDYCKHSIIHYFDQLPIQSPGVNLCS